MLEFGIAMNPQAYRYGQENILPTTREEAMASENGRMRLTLNDKEYSWASVPRLRYSAHQHNDALGRNIQPGMFAVGSSSMETARVSVYMVEKLTPQKVTVIPLVAGWGASQKDPSNLIIIPDSVVEG